MPAWIFQLFQLLGLEQPRLPAKFLLRTQAWLSSDFSPRDGSLIGPFSSSSVEGTVLPKGEKPESSSAVRETRSLLPATGYHQSQSQDSSFDQDGFYSRGRELVPTQSKAIPGKQRACLSAWPGC